jgi:hypothetical protein
MPFANYAELKLAIVDWFEGDDLAGVEGDFIRLAEAELNLRLRVRQRFNLVQIATAGGTPGYDLGATFRRALFIRYTAATLPKLTFRTPEVFYADATAFEQGTPEFYTLVGNEIHLAPVPDGEYQIRIGAHVDLVPLSATPPADVNWLLTLAPQVYLYASLVQAALYLQDDNAAKKWQTLLNASMVVLHADNSGAVDPPVGRSVAA